MSTIQKIWFALYPTDDEHKWMPLIWLPFMLWFFINPYWKHAGAFGHLGRFRDTRGVLCGRTSRSRPC